MYNGKPYFQQIDSQGKGSYLYYYKKDRQYQVGSKLGDNLRALMCTDKSGLIVSHHWQFYGSYDPGMRLVAVTNATPCCSKITIELSGYAAKHHSDVAGDYVPMDKFSRGRHIYQHKSRNLFLHIALEYDSTWSVGSKMGEWGENGDEYIHSASAGSLCPADQRNNYNRRENRKSWRFNSGSMSNVYGYLWAEAGPGNIRLICPSHN